MPYIKLADRPMFDTMIDGLIPKIRGYDRMGISEVAATLVINALTPVTYTGAVWQHVGDIVKALAKRIRTRGDANYCICRILLEGMKPETGWNYHSLSDVITAGDFAINLLYDIQREREIEDAKMLVAISVLDDAIVEIQRRLMGPYEDTAILKNGDMACFNEIFAHKPLNLSGVFSGRPACGCGCGCQCEPGEPILDAFDLSVIKDDDPIPPITDALTQEQHDIIDKERQQNA